LSVPRPVHLHWTGFPFSYGQVQVAEIGFLGCLTKVHYDMVTHC
jgi:ferredoxin-nitrite reductase